MWDSRQCCRRCHRHRSPTRATGWCRWRHQRTDLLNIELGRIAVRIGCRSSHDPAGRHGGRNGRRERGIARGIVGEIERTEILSAFIIARGIRGGDGKAHGIHDFDGATDKLCLPSHGKGELVTAGPRCRPRPHRSPLGCSSPPLTTKKPAAHVPMRRNVFCSGAQRAGRQYNPRHRQRAALLHRDTCVADFPSVK